MKAMILIPVAAMSLYVMQVHAANDARTSRRIPIALPR